MLICCLQTNALAVHDYSVLDDGICVPTDVSFHLTKILLANDIYMVPWNATQMFIILAILIY